MFGFTHDELLNDDAPDERGDAEAVFLLLLAHAIAFGLLGALFG